MKIIKSDWSILQEAEAQGFVASMTNLVTQNRTELSNTLREYFRSQMPGYLGVIDEEDADEVLEAINSYLDENKIDKHHLQFPYSSGNEIYLIPVGEHIQVKVLVVDEYSGDGEYEKYIDISYFVFSEKTSTEDVDTLVHFLKDTLSVHR